MNQVGHLPDSVVLITGAAVTGSAALIVAGLSRRILFVPGDAKLQVHAKLADLVHGSLLAFTVFTLALVLTDVRSNLSKTLDAAQREASTITRLDEELEIAGGSEAAAARRGLRLYVDAVTSSDWPALGAPAPTLSAQADEALKSLRALVRAAARASPESAAAITTFLNQLEDLRLGRLESATKSVPSIFWWIILAFLIAAMAMNGRHPLDLAGATLIALHMAAIGLVLALILVMDQPFRGETSVSPATITQALSAHRSSQ